MCHIVGCRMIDGVFVGSLDGFVEVGGDDACVDVVGQGCGIRVMLGDVMWGGDETCVGEGWVHTVW